MVAVVIVGGMKSLWIARWSAFCALVAFSFSLIAADTAPQQWVHYQGKSGPGKGKKILFISGDEEYRSEEGLPMMAKILAMRHGFDCTVVFALNPADGTIDPNNQTNIVGIEKIKDADMVVMLLRFRELTDAQFKLFDDYLNSGKPIVGLRTATHSFQVSRNPNSAFARYDWRGKTPWEGGFGQHVLGDTWISHHGNHGKESTRAQFNPAQLKNPILTSVSDVWGPTDVYGIKHLPADATVLAYGQILKGMNPTDEAVTDKRNDPMMPLIWTRDYVGDKGKTSKLLATTMGAATDLQNEDLRRLLVNFTYVSLGMTKKLPAKANVDYVDEYKPTAFGFNKYQKGLKPSDFNLK